jgi:biopolymer transport protein ExbD
MSHVGSEENLDPDLTPLLDLVMQLLMFFIVNVNFVAEQVNPDIKLPISESAKPIEKADTQAIFLNQKSMRDRAFVNRLSQDDQERLRNAESVVLIPGVRPMSLLETRAWLKEKYEDLAKRAPDGEVKTMIHFRPDEELELNQLFMLMQHCKVAGFKKLAVRAIVRGGGGK